MENTIINKQQYKNKLFFILKTVNLLLPHPVEVVPALAVLNSSDV